MISKLEYILCSPSFIIVRRYGIQKYTDVLKLLQEYRKNILFLSGEAIEIDAKPLWHVKKKYKLYPNVLFQDGHLRKNIRNGLKSMRSITFWKNFLYREYDVIVTDDDLYGYYKGAVDWERWEQIEVKKKQ